MEIFICKFCNSEKKSRKSLTGHEIFCKMNPDHKIKNTQNAREKALRKVNCKWCENSYTLGNVKKHENSCLSNPDVVKRKEKICPVCNVSFIKRGVTCSRSCANKHFMHSKEGGLKYKSDEKLLKSARYRDICFRYHKKECIVCGEKNIISVHHLNENHDDNRPENLIPLCPTHHQYCHSNFKYLVDEKINQYMIQWKINNGDEEAGSSAAFGAQRVGFDSRVSDQKK